METEQQAAIEALLEEERTFPPPAEFRAQALIADDEVYRRAEEDFEAFWAGLAREFISWFREPTKTLDWEPPHCTWFPDGELNVAYNCLDRHVEAGRGDRSPTTGWASPKARRATSPTASFSFRRPASPTG